MGLDLKIDVIVSLSIKLNIVLKILKISINNTAKNRYRNDIIHEVLKLYNPPEIEIGIFSPKEKNSIIPTMPMIKSKINKMRSDSSDGSILYNLTAV